MPKLIENLRERLLAETRRTLLEEGPSAVNIRGIAQALTRFGKEGCEQFAVSRNGGDEFVMFLYGYPDREALMGSVRALLDRQDAERVALSNGLRVPLRYSVGYSLSTGENDYYGDLFKAADERMYENKRKRKHHRAS